MKNIFPFALMLFATFILSSKSFSQDAGGSASGYANSQPCPVSFKRNNGNGTCGGDAQIRLNFNEAPQFAPTLVAVYYNGAAVTGIILPIEGDLSNFAAKGYISYCLSGSNIPPAKKLVLHFRYPGTGQSDCVIAE